jgi:hypothetical protein
MFDLKRPCKDCPFLKDGTMLHTLDPGRIEGIVESLHEDFPFRCHKTIDYQKEDDEGSIPFEEGNNLCAGSLIYLQKCGKTNTPMQLGERLGWFDPTKLEGHELVIDPLPLSDFKDYFRRESKDS